MADQDRVDDELTENRELEQALATLKLGPSQIDRDRFLFLAGQASAEAMPPGSAVGRWAWPVATFVSSFAALVLGAVLLMHGGQSGNRDSVVSTTVREPLTAPTRETASRDMPELESPDIPQPLEPDQFTSDWARNPNYPRLRAFALARGVDALPEPAPVDNSVLPLPVDEKPFTRRRLLDELLKSDKYQNLPTQYPAG